MRGCVAAVLGVWLVGVTAVSADTFGLKSDKTGQVYGPFDTKPGAKVVIGESSFTVVAVGAAKDMGIAAFAGLWEVDFDRTMEEGKKSPKYDKTTAERMPDMIKKMMAMMKVKVTDKEMVYLRGTRKMAFPFAVKSSDEKSVTGTMKLGPNEATVVFTLIDGVYMNFKSSASDDMDYYVWKKSTGSRTEEQK